MVAPCPAAAEQRACSVEVAAPVYQQLAVLSGEGPVVSVVEARHLPAVVAEEVLYPVAEAVPV